jgi:hypothetical protein
MSPLLRGVLVGAGVMAACLLALWFSLVGGTWLAVTAAAGSVSSRIVGALVLAAGVGALAGSVRLLAGDLRRPERRR